jgi:hypothetical protein
MFLFSNPGANGGNMNDGITTTPNQTTNNNPLSQTSNDLQNAMHHSLLQGFYNCYNSSTLLTNSETKQPAKASQTNENPKKSTTKGNTSFSIDSILGRKNPTLVKNQDSNKINEQSQQKTQNFDYWTLYAAHQYFSQVRSQQSQAPTPFHLYNTQNNKLSYPIENHQNQQQIDQLQAKLFTANIAQQQQQQTKLATSSLNTNSQAFMKQLDQQKEQQNPVVKSKNAKKYKCDLCGRGFSRSNTLITHRVSLKLLLPLFLCVFC